ncbi:MAG: YbaB/EbfC family nucleoid-associated protein [Bdellovibrionales bacterium]|jgi:DNA-binding YbaB/EbfC family protein|nr:YbaB/EbfC family nucleoid-associated protein [Bdellovibrionales bacterium]
MKGFGGGLQQMMRQANQMQARMKKLQEELATREFEGGAGGGAVLVKVNGDNKLLSIQIKPDVVSASDLEMLQDLIVVATNEAIKMAKDTSQQEMSKITGGMNFPGLF